MSFLMESGICEAADDSFGPAVPSQCRGGFDFTLLFQEIFFSIVVDLALVLAASIRLKTLRQAQVVPSGSLLLWSKQCSACCYLAVQLASLVLWSIPSAFKTQLSITSATCNVVAAVMICILSYVEGKRSFRPSSVLNIYLLGSGLFDIVQLRTFWLAGRHNTSLLHVAISTSVSFSLKIVLLVLEAVPKTHVSTPPSREEKSGVYSLRTFWWLNQILWLGSHKKLESNDLFAIDSDLKTARYSSALIDEWGKCNQGDKYALLRAVFLTLKLPLLAPALPRLILIGFNFAQPLLIKRALDFIQQSDEKNIGYGLIGATVVVYCGLAIFNGYYNHLLYRSITLIRGSLIDIVYHKSLSIDLLEAQKAAPAGLITADVERIDSTVEKIHSLWASTIEIGIGIFLLEREVGWACIAPVFVAIICTFSTSLITKILPARQKKWNQAVQERVALTSAMLSNMKTVKMMGYSDYIAITLQNARMSELAASSAFRKCMALVNLIVLIPRQISAPFTFLIFVLAVHKRQLSPSRAFTALAIIELITTPLGFVLQALPSLSSSLACLDRIQKYLSSPDKLGDCKSEIPKSGSSSEKCDSFVVYFEEASVSYRNTESLVLDSISFGVSPGRIAMVIGPVASGKSSLLKAILGELDVRRGNVQVRSPRVGYCDSTPWIPNGSVRDCIIGMNNFQFDKAWYDEVVRACALDEDISSLGTDTEIGSRGIALSEGQKQRLALARAIYSRSPLLVLDDVFRSLDLKTEMLLSENLLSPTGLFKRFNFTVVFATHSGYHLPLADEIIVLETDGRVSQVGSFQELNSQDGYVRCLAIQQLSEERLQDARENIQVKQIPSHKNEANDTKMKHTPPKKVNNNVVGTRDKSIYSFYLRPIGIFRIGVLLAAVISLAFFTRFQRIWVQWWTEADGQRQSMYISVYFLLAAIACLSFTFFFWWMWMFVVPVTAGGLHKKLLDSIMHSPLSYFTTIDSGVILNRFSQDAAIINGQLPVNLFQAVSIAMICLIQIAFISYGSKYLAIAIPITLLVLGVLSRFYLLTSQQLRILDLELKAPVYTCVTETKEGLATIRAFGWQSTYTTTCQSRIDESKKAIYLLFMIQRWLNFVLDMIVAALATILMTLAMELRNSTNAASLGVGLSSVIGFSVNISQFIVCYTEVENSLGAISRIKDCVDSLKPEDSSHEPPPNWPSKGFLEVRNVTASYNDHSNAALKDVSFRVLPGQKVFICGRTGSGKSSLLSVILRLLDIQTGSVLIDGIDITTLSSDALRQRINVIPQSPFFLPGSVRVNLSTSASPTDEAMIAALRKAGLWEVVDQHGGLDAVMSAIPLSHGQQQLFCLATAMMKRSKIVLMDEVASGVDAGTEKRIYQMIEESFRECTVVSITHKLDVVQGADLVVVLSHGECVRQGNPGDMVLLDER